MIRKYLVFFAILPAFVATSAFAANESEVTASNPSRVMVTTADEGLLTFTSEDGSFKWVLDSRIQFDMAGYSGSDNRLSNGIEARRLRLALKGKFWDDWRAELDLDFADNEVDTKDAWIAYDGLGRNNEIKIGNFKQPFSLEEVTSSRMITFMERALPNAFAVGRRVGVSYTHWEDNWRVSGSVFAQELGDGDDDEIGSDESMGYAARANYLPYRGDKGLWLIGASYASYEPNAEDRDDENEIRFRARPETKVERTRFLNTGQVDAVDNVNQYGFETAYQHGPFIVQGEYINTELERFTGNMDAEYDGWYTFASYMITGEQRPYNASDAEFSQFTPSSASGAWEVAIRASSIDLNDFEAGVTGGSADQYTLGVNYYPNRNLRLMFNYSQVDHDEFADGDGDFLGDDDYNIAQARFQVVF